MKKKNENDNNDNHSNKKVDNYFLKSKSINCSNSCILNVNIKTRNSFSSISNDDASSFSSSDLSTSSVTKIKIKYEFANKFIHQEDIKSNDVLCTALNKSLQNLTECNDIFEKRYTKKILETTRTLQRDVLDICKEFKCLPEEGIVHINRFIDNFKTNNIWNVGLIEKEYFSKQKSLQKNEDKKYSHLCLCPCSSMMNKWHSKSICKTSTWHMNMETVPCSSNIMPIEEFVSHVKFLKQHDVYHRVVYEVMKILHSIT